MSTITTRAGKGSPLTNNEVDANFTNLNTDKAELSGAAFTGAITTTSTVDGRDVSTDGSKLDGIEALADVTDTANVTAAGALMDSELTNITAVKALDQGVATTDSPSFVGLTASGEITANGGIALGDGDVATFGDSDDLSIFHAGGTTYLTNTTGSLVLRTDSFRVLNTANSEQILHGDANGAVTAYYDNAVKLATTSTGIDVTGNMIASGNVGIGESSPDAKLHIRDATDGGSSSVTSAIQFSRRNGGSNDAAIKMQHDGSDGVSNLQFHFGGTERARIDADGATIYNGRELRVKRPNGSGDIRLFNTASYATLESTVDPIYIKSANAIRFDTNGNDQRMLIDNSGTVIVGGSAQAEATSVALNPQGYIYAKSSHQQAAFFDRDNSDGDIVTFRKQGAAVGSIGAYNGVPYIGYAGGAGGGIMFNGASIEPTALGSSRTDGANDVGSVNYRWRDIYLSGTAKSQAVELEDIKAKDTNGLNLQTADGQKRVILYNSGAISVGTSTQAVTEIQLNHENSGGKGEIQLNSHGTASFSMLSNFTGSTISGVATGGFGLITPHNYRISISTNGLERMRISASGHIGVFGSGATNERGDIAMTSGTGVSTRRWGFGGGTGSNNSVFYIINEGNVGQYMGHGSQSWTSHSDERIKENITDVGTVLPSLMNMRCVKYNLISNPTDTKIGFIAQDWESAFPEVVDENEHLVLEADGTIGTDENSDSTTPVKAMAYTETLPLLLKAIQEQQTLIESLTARIAALEA